MKRIWVTFFSLLLCHCVTENAENSYRVRSKFTNKVKPTESTWVGVKKKDHHRFAKFEEDDPEDLQQSNYQSEDKTGYIGQYKIGNPYEIFGVSYFPQEYEDFEEIGSASWYGDNFHGKKTANGETYNMKEMTAAHRTLPLPSLVRVTNLENNKSVIVRVNDRGPFAKNRIIDVSEKAAEALNFKNQGVTQVKIELLRNETDDLLLRLGLQN